MGVEGASTELLGEVTVPSGTVVLVDAGLLGLWDADDAWVVDHPATDFRIEGPDARAAGERFDRQWHPTYLYDIPNHGVDELQHMFDDLVAAEGLSARLVPVPGGIAKHARIALALEAGHGTGVVEFYGIRAIVVAGLPADRPLPVVGTPMSEPDLVDRWRSVSLEVTEGIATRIEEIDLVFVDEARLMFADAAALRHWTHEKSLDGKADYVFWGRDAATAAAAHDAPAIDGETFGWLDLPIEEAAKNGLAVEDTREREELHFAGDFRPHSHHHAVLEQMRASPTGSGVVEVGSALFCAFFTSWGDGGFNVRKELDEAGTLLRLVVDLGSDETIERHRALVG